MYVCVLYVYPGMYVLCMHMYVCTYICNCSSYESWSSQICLLMCTYLCVVCVLMHVQYVLCSCRVHVHEYAYVHTVLGCDSSIC